MAFNWLETDGRCYLRSEWGHSLIGTALAESDMAKWKPWSGHRLTILDRSKLPKSPASGRKVLVVDRIPVDVSYKWNNAHKLVWLGDEDSAWATQNLESDYCSLGDKITRGSEKPVGPWPNTHYNRELKYEILRKILAPIFKI